MTHMHAAHPVRLVVEDDLERNRLTVFFRLLLAIPHLIWFFLWTIADPLRRRSSTGSSRSSPAGRRGGLHRLMCAYVRYQRAPQRLSLRSSRNPYPGFMGEAGRVPDRRRLPEEPARSGAGRSLFRIFLAHPGAARSRRRSAARRRELRSSTGGAGTRTSGCSGGGGALSSSPARSSAGSRRSPAGGCRRACATRARTRIGYTRADARVSPARHRPLPERRPDGDARRGLERPPRHPVRLVGDADDLRRSRLTVFFRLPARDPAPRLARALGDRRVLRRDRALVRRRSSAARRRAACTASSRRYVRYRLHVLRLPLPRREPVPRASTGAPGRVSARPRASPEPQRQNRWKTGFRHRPRDPGAPRERGPRRGALHRRRPDVVRRARHGLGAVGPAEPLGLRAALRRADERVLSSSPTLPAREPARGRGRRPVEA